MDYRIPAELEALVARVRDFRERELMPLETEFLATGRLDPAVRRRLQETARDEHGLWALDVPEADGGMGLGNLAQCLVAEELHQQPITFTFGGSPEPALYHCTPGQRERYFAPIVNGEKRTCFAFTEPGAGSDLAHLETYAERDGDHWVINGMKTFIGFVAGADFVILFATVDPSKGAAGVTCFLVDTDTPGFKVGRAIPTMGDGWEPNELHFTDCRVPDANRVGEIGEGWRIANDQLSHGRLVIAAIQLGYAQRSLDLAIERAKERVTWGKPIGARQAIQWMLVDSEVELQAARQLVYRSAWLADNGEATRHDAFVAKLYATEMSQRVTDRCMQVFGGLGYTRELPIQSFFRHARLWRIGHGTSEVHRLMIARSLLGDVAKN